MSTMDPVDQLRSLRPVGASPVHPALRSSVQCIQRFDGHRRTATAWDSLRRDEELWYDDGDCVVHFNNYGTSRRGPSLRICVGDLERSKSAYLLNHCLLPCDRSASLSCEDSGSDSGYSTSKGSERAGAYNQLFLPAPTDLSREDTHAYHIGTRNYFAFLLGKPLVGEKLGTALTDLWDRVQLWQPHDANAADLLSYCEEQGYQNFAENPTYALALLQLSEELGASGAWMDAFAHCVGMRGRLDNCPEKGELSSTTHALITRASLDMGLHIDRSVSALGEFLEEALGPESFGLSRPARDHLDRFRSYMHSFYVEKLGYYPPDANDCWVKETWLGMYDDFRKLYGYLADSESSHDLSSTRGVNGGICVLQNVQAFNERHGFTPLPHPLPLLPDPRARRRTMDAQVGLKAFKLGRTVSITDEIASESPSPLEQAANLDRYYEDSDNPLVREYITFERLKLEEKITPTEARKIRWMLVYGMLQMLGSITRVPSEVKESSSSSYPLCLPNGCRPFLAKMQAQQCRRQQDRLLTKSQSLRPSIDEDRISIHPDCEASSAEEFFSKTGLSRSNSDNTDLMTPAPLRITPQLSRTASIRSSVNSSVVSLQRSVIGSLSRRNGNRRSSVFHSLSRVNSLIMTVPENDDAEDESNQGTSRPSAWLTTGSIRNQQREPSSHSSYDTNSEPTLEDHQLDHFAIDEREEECPSSPVESYVSALSHRNSSRSSVLDSCDSPLSAPSSLDDDDDDLDLDYPSPPTPPRAADPSLATFDFNFHDPSFLLPLTTAAKNQNVGCYTPSGAAAPIPSRVSSLKAFRPFLQPIATNSLLTVPTALRSESFSSVVSSGSSVYPEDSQQAAEIEEEETRGRRRMRGLDRLPVEFGKVDAKFFEAITELR